MRSRRSVDNVAINVIILQPVIFKWTSAFKAALISRPFPALCLRHMAAIRRLCNARRKNRDLFIDLLLTVERLLYCRGFARCKTQIRSVKHGFNQNFIASMLPHP